MFAGALQTLPHDDVVRANVESRQRRHVVKFAPRPSFVSPRQQQRILHVGLIRFHVFIEILQYRI
jgi:hypothetical protein